MNDSTISTSLPEAELKHHELQAFNHLVSTLYQCLHSSDGFNVFFDAFAKHFNALNGGILAVTEHPQRISFGWTFGYPEGFEEWYINSDLPEGDEAITRFRSLPLRKFDSLLQGNNDKYILDVIPTTSPSAAWVEQQGIGDSAGMLVMQNEHQKIIFMANRHHEFGAYSPSELLQMNLLSPHIENALSLWMKIYESKNNSESLSIALNYVNKPIITFNSMAKIIQINNAAHSLIGKTSLLTIDSNETLICSNESINRRLNKIIPTCIIQSHKNTPSTHILFAENRDEKIAILITPLISDSIDHRGVLAELFSYNFDLKVHIERLQALFSCTPAEANIAIELMQGLSAQDIVEKLQLSIHTVRQHIKSLLAKNGYRKQTELIAMLMRALS